MANITAARRYAKALFALSSEQKVTEQVRADLESMVAMMDTSADWKDFILAPVGSHEMRGRILGDLLKGKVHNLTLRFLLFIDAKRRISLLDSIYAEWLALYDETMGILRARVETAYALDPAQLENLSTRLSKRFGKKVELTTSIDEAMIGGLKVFIGDQVHDYSIESQLIQLKKRMIYA